MQINSKKTAVTLVELLLVLTIMGVVAALTVPALKSHSQKTEFAKLAQKAYVSLEQAMANAEAEEGKDIHELPDYDMASGLLRNYLFKYFNSAVECVDSWVSSSKCFSGYTEFDSNAQIKPSVRSVMLLDGTVIAGQGRLNDGISHFIIDVNGSNSPNKEGADVFLFEYGKFNAKCESDSNGQWKLCPRKHAVNLIQDGWTITYW